MHILLEITGDIFANNFEQDEEIIESYKRYLQKFAFSKDVEVVKKFCANQLNQEIFIKEKLHDQREQISYAESSNASSFRFYSIDPSNQEETTSDETTSNPCRNRFSSCCSLFSRPEIKSAVIMSSMITGIGLMILGAVSCASGNAVGVIVLGIGLSLFLASVAMHCKCTPRSDGEAKSILATRLGM